MLCLVLSLMILGACSKQVVQVPQQDVSVFLQENMVEEWEGGTVQDLLYHTGQLRDALDQCNLEKRLAREMLDATSKH